MEKPVEIVEKCEFSTAIPGIFQFRAPGNPMYRAVHNGICKENDKIMSPWEPLRYLEKTGEKVGKLPKLPMHIGAWNGGVRENFVKILQKCKQYDFPLPGNTEGKPTGG